MRQLESRIVDLETHHAVITSDRIHMDRRFDKIEEQIKRTEDTLRKIGWFLSVLVTTSLLGAFLNFVLQGGLANG